MQHLPTPGRRRAPKAHWSVRLRGALTAQRAVKAVAAVGLSATALASVVVPAGASALPETSATGASRSDGGTGAAATVSEAVAQARMETFLGASRGSDRISLATDDTAALAAADAPVAPSDAAVVSPSALTPTVAGAVGVTGIVAVAKPAPVAPAAPAQAAAPAEPAAEAKSAGYSTSAYFGMCRGLGLRPSAARTCSAVRSVFGPLSIGGYRPGDGDHGAGVAVDVMINSRAQGDAIAAWLQAHAGELNIKYLIWRQRYWPAGGSWRMMADRGSPTQNHMDHVHITVY